MVIKSTSDLREVVVLIPSLAAVLAAMVTELVAVNKGICDTGTVVWIITVAESLSHWRNSSVRHEKWYEH